MSGLELWQNILWDTPMSFDATRHFQVISIQAANLSFLMTERYSLLLSTWIRDSLKGKQP